MDKSQQILKIARDRLGNQPTYNPVEFLEMCAVVRDELEAAEQPCAVDTPSALCQKCGLPLVTGLGCIDCD